MENMREKPNMRSVLTMTVFLLVIGGFVLCNRLIAPPEISQSERRPLAEMPAFSVQTLSSAEFMNDFESWAADSFAFRDALRTVRAETVFHVFMQTDKSGLYDGDSGAGKFERIDEDAWRQSAAKIRTVAGGLHGLNVYYSFVPDKSIYAGETLPGFSADEARRILAKELPELTFIDLTDALTGDDFYRTDLHWDQTRLGDVLDTLMSQMGHNGTIPPQQGNGSGASVSGNDNGSGNGNVSFGIIPGSYIALGDFYGVYAGQLALPMASDTMTYIENEAMLNAAVSYLDPVSGEMIQGDIYDFEGFSGSDPYDFFLRGAQPLIVIENPSADTDRELYLFRDSFGSSLAPLLIESYHRVTLIDLRYMDSRMLPSLVEFKQDSDALFLYSSQILNNPSILLISGIIK